MGKLEKALSALRRIEDRLRPHELDDLNDDRRDKRIGHMLARDALKEIEAMPPE